MYIKILLIEINNPNETTLMPTLCDLLIIKSLGIIQTLTLQRVLFSLNGRSENFKHLSFETIS